MCFPLPNLTGSCARGAKPIGGFGLVQEPLPTVTTVPIWLAHHYVVLLPIITGRGLNTHTMISTVLFYIVIVGLVAYASYLKHQLTKK